LEACVEQCIVNTLDSLTREELIGIILRLNEKMETLEQRVGHLEQENEELRSRLGGGGTPDAKSATPEWVKPNRAERRKNERKNRGKWFGRRRETPTETVDHALDRCPDCGRTLTGGTVHRSRQVIDIPVTPATITEHRVIARYCGVCGKIHMPKLDLTDQVIGKHRVGIRLMSLISYLHIECRMPIEVIQRYLGSIHKLHLASGEITKILHKVAELGKTEYEKLLLAVRGSPAVNADETGWREDGKNGYVWSFSTPRIRYFVRDASRASKIPEEVLGKEYEGIVVSDFYSAYGVLSGRHQRCWVHLIRDLKGLAEANPKNRGLAIWVGKVKGIYRRAKAYASEDAKQRHAQRVTFEEELIRLARPYVKREVPQRVLAGRIEKFLSELFMFVEYPEASSDNNAAERSVRPVVITRKISGGTRSAKGSDTKMTLMSLFGTWRLQGGDSIQNCRKMLQPKTLATPT
jgi:transposase